MAEKMKKFIYLAMNHIDTIADTTMNIVSMVDFTFTTIPCFIFAVLLLAHMLLHPLIFTKRHGRKHALTGLTYLLILIIGFLDVALLNSSLFDWPSKGVYYHFILGVAGITLTLTAAFEFQHKNVKNVASGTLDEHATVTFNEMIEHAFYQSLNLVQVLYFHLITTEQSIQSRYLLLFLATTPWLMRSHFPVNSFSANYKQIDERSSSLIRTMYRIKKFQYIFYKHFMLHGLNISVALYGIQLTNTTNFRWYWLILNTSYVMEFFLQTLVKKKYMTQSTMLFMQWLLMIAASVKAMNVLHNVEFRIALASMILNIGTKLRKYDLMNTMLIALLAYLGTQYPGFGIYQDAVIAVGIGITVYHLVEIKMSSYTCTV